MDIANVRNMYDITPTDFVRLVERSVGDARGIYRAA